MGDPLATPRGRGAADTPEPRDRARDVRLVAAGVVVALLVWFAVINLQDVSIHFWLSTTRAPLIVVIVISGLLGAVVGLLARRHRRDRKAGRKAEGSQH